MLCQSANGILRIKKNPVAPLVVVVERPWVLPGTLLVGDAHLKQVSSNPT